MTFVLAVYVSAVIISTHTPLAGRDTGLLVQSYGSAAFQLTRPSRGVTVGFIGDGKWKPEISTHTPLAGRDSIKFEVTYCLYDFNSHAPRGA